MLRFTKILDKIKIFTAVCTWDFYFAYSPIVYLFSLILSVTHWIVLPIILFSCTFLSLLKLISLISKVFDKRRQQVGLVSLENESLRFYQQEKVWRQEFDRKYFTRGWELIEFFLNCIFDFDKLINELNHVN